MPDSRWEISCVAATGAWARSFARQFCQGHGSGRQGIRGAAVKRDGRNFRPQGRKNGDFLAGGNVSLRRNLDHARVLEGAASLGDRADQCSGGSTLRCSEIPRSEPLDAKPGRGAGVAGYSSVPQSLSGRGYVFTRPLLADGGNGCPGPETAIDEDVLRGTKMFLYAGDQSKGSGGANFAERDLDRA